jgi:L-fuconolactonase
MERKEAHLMEIVDGQLHEPGVWFEWKDAQPETWHNVMTESLLTTMDAVGVDAAVLVPSYDQVWTQRVAAEYPERFASVPRLYSGPPSPPSDEIDPEAPDIEDQLVEMFGRPGIRGIRFSIGFWDEVVARWKEGAFDRAVEVCSRHDIPIFLFASGHIDIVAPVAERYPDLQIALDHMGIRQPPLEPVDSPPWRRLDELLELAKYPNICVKLCGAPSLSLEGPPYSDSWAALERILEAFGASRLFWASDISRFRGRLGARQFTVAQADYVGKHTYAQSLAFFADSSLSDSEKQLILGGTIRQILDWPAAA